jgi:hypothetical protein
MPVFVSRESEPLLYDTRTKNFEPNIHALTSERKRIAMHSRTNMETPPPDALCSLASSTVLGKTSNRLRKARLSMVWENAGVCLNQLSPDATLYFVSFRCKRYVVLQNTEATKRPQNEEQQEEKTSYF